MMTGALLGGSSVSQAARLQIVIMFMIAASTALEAMSVVALCIAVVVDSEGRIRSSRVKGRLRVGMFIKEGLGGMWSRFRRLKRDRAEAEEA